MGADSRMIKATEPYALVDTRHGPMLANRQDIYIGQSLIEYGEYCEHETQLLQQFINRPGTIVEVGANVGSQTVPLAKAAKAVGADVIAIEAQPFVFQNLCANLALNALDNVMAWPFACAAEPGTVSFERPDYRQPGNFGAVSMQTEATAEGIEVPCVRLDDATQGRNVYLLKVDVEGFELPVLQGAQATLASSRPVLYVENDRVSQSQALIEYLWGQGYRLWWHISPYFNPQNFRASQDNRYPGQAAFNMLGLPRESEMTIQGGEEIVDATVHPLAKR
jgi:FkbM family methyltransferase